MSCFDTEYTYHAADVYFARFEREVSGASCAGLFCDELDSALLLPLTSIVNTISHDLRQREMGVGAMNALSARDARGWH